MFTHTMSYNYCRIFIVVCLLSYNYCHIIIVIQISSIYKDSINNIKLFLENQSYKHCPFI